MHHTLKTVTSGTIVLRNGDELLDLLSILRDLNIGPAQRAIITSVETHNILSIIHFEVLNV